MSIANCDGPTESAASVSAPRPLARAWLWHPWYAKLWWSAMIAYWLGQLASFSLAPLEAFYTIALAAFLNILFFPPTILMILGLGFARAWFAWSDWELMPPTREGMPPGSSMGIGLDPYTDPLDPRSGPTHWRHLYEEQ